MREDLREVNERAGGSVLVLDNELIFVSIASYRDVQLVPTIEDLLAKAHEPGLLRFGICWQHGPDEPPLPFEGDERFRILDVDWRDSRGACWARAEIMHLWRGEKWFFQVDSHCRFIPGWDTKLVRMMGQTESPKPILSTYGIAFTPRAAGSQIPEILAGLPHQIMIETFSEDGIPELKPHIIPDLAGRKKPLAARFLGAGFVFAPGSFVEEVPYDPELYFFGEEISMTLRAFTSGYDLFHPIESIAWHDYVRAYATRHWDDHLRAGSDAINKGPLHSDELDMLSRQKVRQLLHCENTTSSSSNLSGRFGLGSERTVEEYERYAGLSFELRKFQDYTRYGFEPPNPESPADWPDRIYTWLVRVAVNVADLSAGALDELSFWMVTIQDESHREIRRHDFQRKDLIVDGAESQIILICEMQSGIIPAFWSVWPFSRAGGWGRKLEGALAESDFSIVED